jgi:hypothetical protein
MIQRSRVLGFLLSLTALVTTFSGIVMAVPGNHYEGVWGSFRSSNSDTSVTTAATTTFIRNMPRGGDSDEYARQLESVKANVLQSLSSSLDELRRDIVDGGKVVPDFGVRAESIVNQALEAYCTQAPDAGDDEAKAAVYDRKMSQLEASVDAPLHVLYLKQLAYLRTQALEQYRTALQAGGAATGDYEAMLQADATFCRQAEAAIREGASADWDFGAERAFLQAVMGNLAAATRQTMEVQKNNAQQQQTTMQFLQQQQQMIQQLQMQLYGQTSPWNIGVAYRIPDTNFNLQGTYQQGRANVQLSCVPDEYAAFLGPNGFTNGVGPGNLGLSLNLSV